MKIEEQQVYCYQKWEPNLAILQQQEILSRNEKKYQHPVQFKQLGRYGKNYDYDPAESSKSEEEAATTIQAVYRGYKARRKFNEVSVESLSIQRESLP